jgi:hypothetical protein
LIGFCSFFSPFPEEKEKENPPCGGKRPSWSCLRDEEVVVCAEDSSMLGILFFLDRIYPGETKTKAGFHGASRIYWILFFLNSRTELRKNNPPAAEGDYYNRTLFTI